MLKTVERPLRKELILTEKLKKDIERVLTGKISGARVFTRRASYIIARHREAKEMLWVQERGRLFPFARPVPPDFFLRLVVDEEITGIRPIKHN